MKQDVKREITPKTVFEVLFRELGLRGMSLKTISKGERYECRLGRCRAVVTYDERRGAIHLAVYRSDSFSIHAFLDPVTLEQDDAAQQDYMRVIRAEIMEGQ